MKHQNVDSMKVFFFKGQKLEMPKNWYYHVAPLVLYKGIPVVVDKGLFEGATYLSDWLKAFSEGKTCKEIYSMDQYRAFQKSEHCMYFIVPMYYYSPNDLENLNKESFDPSDMSDMLISLPRSQRNKYMNKYPI